MSFIGKKCGDCTFYEDQPKIDTKGNGPCIDVILEIKPSDDACVCFTEKENVHNKSNK